MSKQPLGKTLLRNVIRHTDAHNKIQEEMEMWKMRDWEIQASDHKHLPNTDIMRGRMHCDRVPDQSRHTRERVSEHDDREARYWTRKLYEFEASDPDRWGHSGFKELYPEEFDSNSDKSVTLKKTRHHKMKKSRPDLCLSKRSKKSSRKKKKKKKKAEDGKRKKDESSSNDSGTDDRSDTKDKQKKKKKTKSRHKNKKGAKTQRRDELSSSGESEEKKERRTNGRKKRKRDSLKDSESDLDSKKKRREDCKATGKESSGGSSPD